MTVGNTARAEVDDDVGDTLVGELRSTRVSSPVSRRKSSSRKSNESGVCKT